MYKRQLLKKLENLENVTPNERILIDAILKDPESFIAAKPKEIASLTYVSVPTIYRLINKLGLCGVNDLKLQLQDCLLYTSQHRRIHARGSGRDIVAGIG